MVKITKLLLNLKIPEMLTFFILSAHKLRSTLFDDIFVLLSFFYFKTFLNFSIILIFFPFCTFHFFLFFLWNLRRLKLGCKCGVYIYFWNDNRESSITINRSTIQSIAWKKICRLKFEGKLGIKKIEDDNVIVLQWTGMKSFDITK